MLAAYRSWLESELALLGNASHHAYAFGQANMAKRAIEELDERFAGRVVLALPRATADALAAELADAREPSLAMAAFREALAAALAATPLL